MNIQTRRIEALKAQGGRAGIVTVIVYEEEAGDDAMAAHIASGKDDPENAEPLVLVHKPGSRLAAQ